MENINSVSEIQNSAQKCVLHRHTHARHELESRYLDPEHSDFDQQLLLDHTFWHLLASTVASR